MILLQLSSGRGPIECCKAIGMAYQQLISDANKQGINVKLLEQETADQSGCFKSLLVKLDSSDQQQVKHFAELWHGPMLWVWQSQFRPKHKRKNWFFSGQYYEISDHKPDSEVTYHACRASGAGGQHVNTTDSVVRATHQATGISVRVETERSQHANKRLANILLKQKLAMLEQDKLEQQQQSRWQQHTQLQRDNPIKTFKGDRFILVK